MDNQNSRPAISLPEIPADFEAKCGTSKTDFARALLELLAGASVTGVTQEGAADYDTAAIIKKLDAHQEVIDRAAKRVPRRVTMDGVNNGVVVVAFDDIGTTNYEVVLAFVTPNVNFDPIQWSIVDGSKKTNQVTLRLDGRVGAFKIEVTITPMDGI